MDSFLTGLSESFGPLYLVLGALFAFVESALGVGFVLPGETAVLTLGAATSTGAQVSAAMAAVAVGAVAGDHVGYLLGSRHGHRLRRSRAVRRMGVRHWDRGARLVRRYGTLAVIVSRLLPAVRTIVPAAAGAGGLRYRRFLLGSMVGAALWSALWVGLGAAARAALPEVADRLGTAGWVALGLVVLAIAGAVGVRRLRRRGSASECPDEIDHEDLAEAA